MATIKSYTNLSQSKELAEILPPESADMYWFRKDTEIPKVFPEDMMHNSVSVTCPCWSLAALLDVMPEVNGVSVKMEKLKAQDGYKGYYYCIEYENLILIPYKTNPVDACYKMILKLHELYLL